MDVPAAIKDADSTREAQLLESWKAYKKGFQGGIALFNKKPKKGIAFMQVCCQVCCLFLSCKLQAITFSVPQLGKLLMFPILFPQTCYNVKAFQLSPDLCQLSATIAYIHMLSLPCSP